MKETMLQGRIIVNENPDIQTTTAYIPTPFIVPPKIEVGENWFVKLPGWNYVFTSEILEVTEKTVKIKFGNHPPPQRFKKTDVEFIEKVE